MGIRLHTARYSNPAVAAAVRDERLVPIGIVRYPPRWPLPYDVRANLYDLAPTAAMLELSKQEGRAAFQAVYRARLNALGADTILAQLQGLVRRVLVRGHLGAELRQDAGFVLLCFEDVTVPDAWCHRLLLGEWLIEQGVPITELPDEGKPVKPGKPRKDSPPSPSLFSPGVV